MARMGTTATRLGEEKSGCILCLGVGIGQYSFVPVIKGPLLVIFAKHLQFRIRNRSYRKGVEKSSPPNPEGLVHFHSGGYVALCSIDTRLSNRPL